MSAEASLMKGDFLLQASKENDSTLTLMSAIEEGDLDEVNRLLGIEAISEAAASNANVALRMAASEGKLPIVNRLLEIEAVGKAAAEGDNAALRFAAEAGHNLVVKRLLEIEAVREAAAVNQNEILRIAIINTRLGVVEQLLEIPAVRETAAVNDNELLKLAAKKCDPIITEKGYVLVATLLLKIKAVREAAAVDDNQILKMVIMNNHVFNHTNISEVRQEMLKARLVVVEQLLEIPAVRETAAENDNELLKLAVEKGELPIVNGLLKIKAVSEAAAAKLDVFLKIASTKNHFHIFARLMQMDKKNASPMDTAAKKNTANGSSESHTDEIDEKSRVEAMERKKAEDLKMQCDNLYARYISILKNFHELSTSVLSKSLDQMKVLYQKITNLLIENNAILEDQKQSVVQSTKRRNPQAQAVSMLTSNKDRLVSAKNSYNECLAVCDYKEYLIVWDKEEKEKAEKVINNKIAPQMDYRKLPVDYRVLREQFDLDHSKTLTPIVQALNGVNFTQMTDFIAPLENHLKTAEDLQKKLKENLDNMNAIYEKLEEQNGKLSLARQVIATKDKNEQEQTAQKGQQAFALILKRIKEDDEKQRLQNEKQNNEKQRLLKREEWLVKGKVIQALKTQQRLQIKMALQKQLITKGNVVAKKADPEQVSRKPRSLLLKEQLDQPLKKITIDKYLASFRNMVEEQFTFAEEYREVEGYALLGHLSQLLEAMKKEKGKMGKLALELRNTLYHANPNLIRLDKDNIERLTNMILVLLGMNWNNSQAVEKTILPAYFVELVWYPRSVLANTNNLSVEALSQLIAKEDYAKTDMLKIPPPSPYQAKKYYDFCAKKRKAIQNVKGIHEKVKMQAMGYLEGLMGGYALLDLQRRNFLIRDAQRSHIISSGRAFRHNNGVILKHTTGMDDPIGDLKEQNEGVSIATMPTVAAAAGAGADARAKVERHAQLKEAVDEKSGMVKATMDSHEKNADSTPAKAASAGRSTDKGVLTFTAGEPSNQLTFSHQMRPRIRIEAAKVEIRYYDNHVNVEFGANQDAAQRFIQYLNTIQLQYKLRTLGDNFIVSISITENEFNQKVDLSKLRGYEIIKHDCRHLKIQLK